MSEGGRQENSTTTTSDSPSSSPTNKRPIMSPSQQEIDRVSESVKKVRAVEASVADDFSEQVTERVAAAEGDVSADQAQIQQQEAAKVISLSHEVRHEVAVPEGYPYIPLAQHVQWPNPAREYPFTLDPFQRLAINCLERSESVLVSAHTSAGKTVVAEYAIAMSLRCKQRVIYTSPIKALSNQKYRELQERFTDVGLMTGDVTLNPDASCLVMTTEILRSMLYRGSEVMREVAWVIFDEIHYMRDKERGVVWEETIILLPHNVHFVFLSATIPNARQFARWIVHIHQQPCHVVYTNYRPTPLQHYLFPTGADGIFLVVDEKGAFREDNFRKALSVFSTSADQNGAAIKSPTPFGPVLGKNNQRKRTKGETAAADLYKIIKMIIAKSYQPVIVFSFSKRDCEEYAMKLSKLDFNQDEEKVLVGEVFRNAIESLSEEDRELPQIQSILPLLKRGIGIHHSGLLPILKEVIEILFQEGLLKVLFATETFSIGLNMPAKTVVFTSVRKFDGKEFRWISSGEYIQMSGRAGRRGLDTRGIVIMMVEEQMDPPVCQNMIKGQADALNSAFHLSYNMILNLMRVEGTSPDYMLEKSFFQFQSGDSIPALEERLARMTAEWEGMSVEHEADLQRYHEAQQELGKLRGDLRRIIHHPSYALPFLQAGRLVRVRCGEDDFGWGVVVNVLKKGGPGNGKSGGHARKEEYIVDCLLNCARTANINTDAAKPAPPGQLGEMRIVPCLLGTLDGISSIRTHLPQDLRSADQRALVLKSLSVVKSKFPEGLPLLDPIRDMKVQDAAFSDLLRKIDTLESALHGIPIAKHPALPTLLSHYQAKAAKRQEMSALKRDIKDANSILQMEELCNRKRVLRRLGYCTEDDVIELKGRVACEISTGDELLLTELIFSGQFNELTIEQTVSLLSCLVFQEKSDEPPKLRDELAGPLRMLHDAARRVAKVSGECKLHIEEADYLATLRPELMEVVFAWCRGAKFAKICTMTDVFEGSIIRCMRRLEELLRQLACAAKSIGNDTLEAKFTEGIAKLKRDIVFANSLYL